MKKQKQPRFYLWHLRLLALSGLILLSLCDQSLVLAQTAQYQSVEPKLDSPESRPKEPLKTKAPLVGNVQHVEKPGTRKAKSLFGAKKGYADTPSIKANVNDSALQAQLESSIGIVGVKFIASFGRPPVINQIFPGTPAEQVGLRISDVIVAVDGIPTAGLTKDEVFDLIVGTPGTYVSLTILRNNDYRTVSCVRMDINNLADARIRRDYLIRM